MKLYLSQPPRKSSALTHSESLGRCCVTVTVNLEQRLHDRSESRPGHDSDYYHTSPTRGRQRSLPCTCQTCRSQRAWRRVELQACKTRKPPRDQARHRLDRMVPAYSHRQDLPFLGSSLHRATTELFMQASHVVSVESRTSKACGTNASNARVSLSSTCSITRR